MRILGSETEFGLVAKNTMDCWKILSFARRKFWESGIPNEEEKDKVVRGFNWWKEDLTIEEDVDEDSKTADTLRRLGVSGEYLSNGSRFYLDGGHLEYSTAECASPWDLIAYEKAGERIVYDFVENAKKELRVNGNLLKRNSDYVGASYACHGNYCISRQLFEKIAPPNCGLSFDGYSGIEQAIWVLHQISLQFITGSGRIDPLLNWPECFGLSQRQPFIKYFGAVATTGARSIINLRDRPYADPKRFGRLHVICGDSNRADWSNLIKYGSALLLLAALENSVPEKDKGFFYVTDPLLAFGSIKDRNSQIKTVSGLMTAIEAQRLIWSFVKEWHDARGPVVSHVAGEILDAWKEALDLIETENERIYSMFDFFIKKKFFEDRASSGSFKTRDFQSLEYVYHLVGKKSLFDDLLQRDLVEELVPDSSVKRALNEPPKTRAKLRRRLIERFSSAGFSRENIWPSWHSVRAREGDDAVVAVMPDPASFEEHLMFGELEYLETKYKELF